MDHDREEHNPQQPRGGNGVGSSRRKNLEISEGDVPKQKEPKRGRSPSELSEQQKEENKEKHNASCRKSRGKKRAEFLRLQNFEKEYREEFEDLSLKSLKDVLHELRDFKNEFQEEFGSLSPKSLKEKLSKLGVTKEVLEDERTEGPSDVFGEALICSQPTTLGREEVAMNETSHPDDLVVDEDENYDLGSFFTGPDQLQQSINELFDINSGEHGTLSNGQSQPTGVSKWKPVCRLQVSLTAAGKSLHADTAARQPGELGGPASPYDSEGATSLESRTSGGSAPIKSASDVPDAWPGRETNGTLTAVSHLVEESKQEIRAFAVNAKPLIKGEIAQQSSHTNPNKDLRRLKLKFETWKKDANMRLMEAKAKLHNVGHSEGPRKLWGMLSSKVTMSIAINNHEI